jgi:hypothetical protein
MTKRGVAVIKEAVSAYLELLTQCSPGRIYENNC